MISCVVPIRVELLYHSHVSGEPVDESVQVIDWGFSPVRGVQSKIATGGLPFHHYHIRKTVRWKRLEE